MKALKLALAGLLMLCALSPAPAKTVIADDPGGIIVDFVVKYSNMRDSGEKVVVDGECVSACTVLLGLLRPENVCATPHAVFGFHSASVRIVEKDKSIRYEHAPEMSKLMFGIYPRQVRALLKSYGWNGESILDNAHPSIIWIKGKQLRKIVRPCLATDLS
jgi:hypothetical protein